jgi:hypothetical protein
VKVFCADYPRCTGLEAARVARGGLFVSEDQNPHQDHAATERGHYLSGTGRKGSVCKDG